MNKRAQMVTRTKKVFVGGLSAQTTLEDVRAYFEQFGSVSFSFPSASNFAMGARQSKESPTNQTDRPRQADRGRDAHVRQANKSAPR